MRDYLYIWHQPDSHRLILSGVEFKDFLPELRLSCGVVLLRHKYGSAYTDGSTRFDYVPADELEELSQDDIYQYGDFTFADYSTQAELPKLTDQAVAELTFFGQMVRPLNEVEIPGLGNRFLYGGHDDGWYLRLFYRDWGDVAPLLCRLLAKVITPESAQPLTESLRKGKAIWCQNGIVQECEGRENIDEVRSRRP